MPKDKRGGRRAVAEQKRKEKADNGTTIRMPLKKGALADRLEQIKNDAEVAKISAQVQAEKKKMEAGKSLLPKGIFDIVQDPRYQDFYKISYNQAEELYSKAPNGASFWVENGMGDTRTAITKMDNGQWRVLTKNGYYTLKTPQGLAMQLSSMRIVRRK